MTVNEKQAVQDFYDEEAHRYFSSRYVGPTADSQVWRARADLVMDLVGTVSGVVVDLGCGPGVLAPRLITRAESVVSADLSIEMLRAGRCALGDNPRAHWVNCDLVSLPFRTSSVETLVVIGVFGLVEDGSHALQEFARILRPRGRLILQVPSSRNPRKWLDRPTRVLGLAVKEAYEARLALGRIAPRSYTVNELADSAARYGFTARRRRFYDFRLPLLSSLSVNWDARVERQLHRWLSGRRLLGQLGEGMVIEFIRSTPS